MPGGLVCISCAEAGSTMGFVAVLALIAGVAFWCVGGIIKAIRSRLADRFASWLLPDGQPSTLRFALGFTRIADRISPRSLFAYSWRPEPAVRFDSGLAGAGEYGMRRHSNTWSEPDAARQELLFDLSAGRYVTQPVRFVWPLVRIAIKLRVKNAYAVLSLLAAWTCKCLVYVIVAIGGIWSVRQGNVDYAVSLVVVVVSLASLGELRSIVAGGSECLKHEYLARLRWLLPCTLVLFAILIKSETEVGRTLLTPIDPTFGHGAIFLPISAVFFGVILFDLYVMRPRLAKLGGRSGLKNLSRAEAKELTRMLLLRSVAPVHLLLLVCVTLELVVAMQGPMSPFLWGVALSPCASLLIGFHRLRGSVTFFVSPLVRLGDRVDTPFWRSNHSTTEGEAVDSWEAVDVTFAGVIWLPVEDVGECGGIREQAVCTSFAMLLEHMPDQVRVVV